MFVRSFVPPLGHPARPEAQPARPEAQQAMPEAQPAMPEAQPARSEAQPSLRLQEWLAGPPEGGMDGQMYGKSPHSEGLRPLFDAFGLLISCMHAIKDLLVGPSVCY